MTGFPDDRRAGRRQYVHSACGQPTGLMEQMAVMLDRDPAFYTHLPCAACEDVFPAGEFVWQDNGEPVGEA